MSELRHCVTRTVEALALNEAQTLVIFDPSPEVDSLAERIIILRRHGVPESVVRAILADVKRLLTLNASERSEQLDVAGRLDRLATADPALRDHLTFKGLARHLRDDLALLAGAVLPCEAAVMLRLRAVVRGAPPEMLASATLRHELGGRRHDALLLLLGDGA